MARTTMAKQQLRRGWTTGACATAAVKAAYTALLTGRFPDPVVISLPGGETPAFALALEGKGEDWAEAGVIKDAGDDPDVTHGAMIVACVRRAGAGSGVSFLAGAGVGSVTRPGLPVKVGEPAINPVPRQMMRQVVQALAEAHGETGDVEIEIAVPGGEALAAKTWNPRLGIKGGLSILGTTGIVKPFSCAAWIASIHRGIDVARAAGFTHIAGATGSTSEAALQALYRLPLEALIDMGDFVGGMLKYVRAHPVPRVTVAGGFGKITKMAQGAMDLHSGRSQVDFDWLAALAAALGGGEGVVEQVRRANTAMEAETVARALGLPLAEAVARSAREAGLAMLRGADVALDIVVVDRSGQVIGHGG